MITSKMAQEIYKKAKLKNEKEEEEIYKSEIEKLNSIKEIILNEIEPYIYKEANIGIMSSVNVHLIDLPILYAFIQNTTLCISNIKSILKSWFDEYGYEITYIRGRDPFSFEGIRVNW